MLATDCRPGPYERPLFFGGQLLTEDDLQALVDYVVGKNRLHNRALWGDGVVCGLMVTCDPCGGSKVVVQPGYALDCCGNDIAVECPVTLDINQMIRDLRARRLGKDCGDPCKNASEEGTATPTEGDTKASEAEPLEVTDIRRLPLYRRLDQGDDRRKPTRHRNHEHAAETYCLYVRYCEQPSDPVAPYVTDDCSPTACRATRLTEGYTFELRCKTTKPRAQTMWDRVRDCMGDLGSIGDAPRRALLLRRAFEPVAVSCRRVLSAAEVAFDATDRDALAWHVEELERHIRSKVRESEEEIIDGILLLIEVGALAAREHQATHRGGGARSHARRWPSIVEAAVEHYQARVNRVRDHFARTLVEETLAFFESPLEELLERAPGRVYLLTNGSFLALTLMHAAVDPARALRDGLLERVTSGGLTRCWLREAIERVPLPRYDADEIDFDRCLVFSERVLELTRLLLEYELECLCDSLNPPCAPCDDPGVLLACIEWCDCKVVDICDVERKWVITGPNLRYWLPGIARLGARVERLCCGDTCDEDRRRYDDWKRKRGSSAAFAQLLAPETPDLMGMLLGGPAQPSVALTSPSERLWQSRYEELRERLERMESRMKQTGETRRPKDTKPSEKS
jgi:hypothetical protein